MNIDTVIQWQLTTSYLMIDDYVYVLHKLNKKYKNKIKWYKIKNQNKKRLQVMNDIYNLFIIFLGYEVYLSSFICKPKDILKYASALQLLFVLLSGEGTSFQNNIKISSPWKRLGQIPYVFQSIDENTYYLR